MEKERKEERKEGRMLTRKGYLENRSENRGMISLLLCICMLNARSDCQIVFLIVVFTVNKFNERVTPPFMQVAIL